MPYIGGTKKMSEKIATRDAYGKALAKLGAVNPKVVVLDADLSKSTKTADFYKVFPERFINVGIAEQNLIGISAGLATAGMIPFASTFAMFATGRAYEIIRNSVCYPQLNVKICASHAGLTVGEDGGSHQSIEDIALMRVIPHMTVIVPADSVETEQAVFAVAEMKGPVYMRLGRPAVPVLFGEDYKFEIGKAVTMREGKDAVVIACGLMVAEAINAAQELAKDGIDIKVINMATIKPLDEVAVISAAKETGAVVTAEEHSIIGGLGGAVAEVLGENCPVPLVRVGVKDIFGESGTPNELLIKYGLTTAEIVQAVRKAISKK